MYFPMQTKYASWGLSPFLRLISLTTAGFYHLCDGCKMLPKTILVWRYIFSRSSVIMGCMFTFVNVIGGISGVIFVITDVKQL